MAMFNSYVGLPEGMPWISTYYNIYGFDAGHFRPVSRGTQRDSARIPGPPTVNPWGAALKQRSFLQETDV